MLLVGSSPFFRSDIVTFFVLADGWLFIMATVLLLAAPWHRLPAFARMVRRCPVFSKPKKSSFDECALMFTSLHTRSEVAWAAFARLKLGGGLGRVCPSQGRRSLY